MCESVACVCAFMLVCACVRACVHVCVCVFDTHTSHKDKLDIASRTTASVSLESIPYLMYFWRHDSDTTE